MKHVIKTMSPAAWNAFVILCIFMAVVTIATIFAFCASIYSELWTYRWGFLGMMGFGVLMGLILFLKVSSDLAESR